MSISALPLSRRNRFTYYRQTFSESFMRKEFGTLLLHNLLEIKYNSP